jgi:hypothetical protein
MEAKITIRTPPPRVIQKRGLPCPSDRMPCPSPDMNQPHCQSASVILRTSQTTCLPRYPIIPIC